MGRQRETGGNATQADREIDRRVSARTPDEIDGNADRFLHLVRGEMFYRSLDSPSTLELR